jgi:hypothetical protein
LSSKVLIKQQQHGGYIFIPGLHCSVI